MELFKRHARNKDAQVTNKEGQSVNRHTENYDCFLGGKVLSAEMKSGKGKRYGKVVLQPVDDPILGIPINGETIYFYNNKDATPADELADMILSKKDEATGEWIQPKNPLKSGDVVLIRCTKSISTVEGEDPRVNYFGTRVFKRRGRITYIKDDYKKGEGCYAVIGTACIGNDTIGVPVSVQKNDKSWNNDIFCNLTDMENGCSESLINQITENEVPGFDKEGNEKTFHPVGIFIIPSGQWKPEKDASGDTVDITGIISSYAVFPVTPAAKPVPKAQETPAAAPATASANASVPANQSNDQNFSNIPNNIPNDEELPFN